MDDEAILRTLLINVWKTGPHIWIRISLLELETLKIRKLPGFRPRPRRSPRSPNRLGRDITTPPHTQLPRRLWRLAAR